MCPTGDNTACSINCGATCESSTIVTGNGNNMDSFSLYCQTANGCNYLDIALTSATIENVSITCDEEEACRYTTFAIDSSITNFQLECVADRSCRGTIFNFDSSNIDQFNLDCSSSSPNRNPCDDSEINAENTIINDLMLNCSNCDDLLLSTQVANSAMIKCGEVDQSCADNYEPQSCCKLC